ncbi:MAG: sigma-70 family RNA polymerase sigma factor [Planctomycetes bacterium]|nr:sigma-70 family RNA polymerase sigma factor [Planctomycetota bacterium]
MERPLSLDRNLRTSRPHGAAGQGPHQTAAPAKETTPLFYSSIQSAEEEEKNAPTVAEECPGAAPTAEQVFREYAPRVYNLARRMLTNESDAEDVTSEVLLQVVRKLDTFRGESSLATWLYRITANAALALRRKRATHPERQISDPMDQFLADGSHATPVRGWAAGPVQQVLGHELSQMIEKAVAGLPALYRDVFVLADLEGLANAEIGEVLRLSLPAVKSRLHRARLSLRHALAPYFEEISG